MGKPISTDCLTLNVTSGQWERGRFTNGLFGDGVRGVIDMGENGVFMFRRWVDPLLFYSSNMWCEWIIEVVWLSLRLSM